MMPFLAADTQWPELIPLDHGQCSLQQTARTLLYAHHSPLLEQQYAHRERIQGPVSLKTGCVGRIHNKNGVFYRAGYAKTN